MLVIGCHHDSIKQRLDTYEEYLEQSPREVYLLLKKLQVEGFSLSEEEQMRMDYLTVKAKDKASIPLNVQDSVVLSNLIEYYGKHGTPNQQMGAYYLLGGVYRDLGDAPMAVETYLKAVNSADTTDAHCDYSTLARIIGQLDDMERLQGLIKNRYLYSYQAERYARKANDKKFLLDVRLGLVARKLLDVDYSPLRKQVPSLINQCMALGDTLLAVKQTVGFAWSYLHVGHLAETQQMLRLFEAYSGQVYPVTHECPFPIYYGVKGMSLLRQGQRDSAEFFFRKELTDADWNNRQMAYCGLKELYVQVGCADSALKYATQQCEAVDSDYQQKSAAELQRLQTAFNYAHYREQLFESQIEIIHQRTWLVVVVSIGVILLLSILLAYYVHRDRRREQYKKILEKEAEAEQRIQELTHIIFEETEEAEQKQQVLLSLEKQLATYKDIKERLLDKNEVHRLIDEATDSHRQLHREEWEQLEAFLLQQQPDFYSKLQSLVPKLNETERQVSLLFRLKVPVGHIALLVGRTASAVFNIRQRLYKKASSQHPASIEDADKWLSTL